MKSRTLPPKNPTDLTHLLQGMKRDKLRTIAKKLNVPRGRNADDTIRNLSDALEHQRFHLRAVVLF